MGTYQDIISRRTIRKFKQIPLTNQVLEKCVNAARLAPSAKNLQPLEYIVITKNMGKVLSTLKFGGGLKEGKQKEGEKPTAYIIILINKKIESNWYAYDVGLAAENIMLTAQEEGIGTCCLGAVEEEKLKEILGIPGHCEIELVIALGYPAEKSIAEDFVDSTKYWRDEEDVLHIPKRKLKEIMHKESY